MNNFISFLYLKHKQYSNSNIWPEWRFFKSRLVLRTFIFKFSPKWYSNYLNKILTTPPCAIYCLIYCVKLSLITRVYVICEIIFIVFLLIIKTLCMYVFIYFIVLIKIMINISNIHTIKLYLFYTYDEWIKNKNFYYTEFCYVWCLP